LYINGVSQWCRRRRREEEVEEEGGGGGGGRRRGQVWRRITQMFIASCEQTC